jgi:hypothetical protein
MGHTLSDTTVLVKGEPQRVFVSLLRDRAVHKVEGVDDAGPGNQVPPLPADASHLAPLTARWPQAGTTRRGCWREDTGALLARIDTSGDQVRPASLI